jgi:AcrR family transcriptional regulator
MSGRSRKLSDLREECVREALEIIATDGLEKLSLREVARRLGVSHQAPYKHFESRDHILAEAVSRAYESFAKHLDARPRASDPYQDLGLLGRAYLDYAKKHPLSYRLMFGTPLPPPYEHPEMLKQARHAFSALFSAVEKLPGRQTGSPVELDALFALSTVHGLASIMEREAMAGIGLDMDDRHNVESRVLSLIARALGAPDAEKAQASD